MSILNCPSGFELKALAQRNPALGALAGVFFLVALNSLYNSLASAFGVGFPHTTFLFTPSDLFADYFKAVFSYPGSENIRLEGTSRLSKLLVGYLHENPYGSVDNLALGKLSNLHGMPLPTLWALGNVRLMAVVAPFKLFFLMSVPVLFGLYFILHKVSLTARDRLIWCTLAAISYPMLFVATRGHLMAGMITVLLLAFVMLMYTNTHQWLAFLLLAIVVNLRPNTIIFASLLLITQPRNIIRNCLFFGFTALAIFLCSFLLATNIYPDYTFENFSIAVSIYHATYVAGSAGLAYGSSLLGGLKVLFGYHRFFELGILAIGLVTLVAFSVLLHFGKLSRVCYVFIVCALYALCPSVFGDYYLLIFIAPLLCLYLGSISELSAGASWSNSDLAIFLVSVLLLAPKNYVFMRGGVSPQVLINPMLLLAAVVFCLQQAYTAGRTTKPLRG